MTTPTQYSDVEVWIAVDSSGSAVVAPDEAELDTTDLSDCGAVRVVCLTVRMPVPRPQRATATVATDTTDGAELTVTVQ